MPIKGTQMLDIVARKVALPRLVLTKARCQKIRSPAKKKPAQTSGPMLPCGTRKVALSR